MNKRKEVANELVELMEKVDDAQIEAFKKIIESSNRIFTAGMGRSGFMMRGFAMRLMHMGYKTYVVGETTTPAILEGDVLVLGSGCTSAVVISKIDNKLGIGQVKVKGQVWSANSFTDEIIEENEEVKIKKIEGVHLIVQKENDKEG